MKRIRASKANNNRTQETKQNVTQVVSAYKDPYLSIRTRARTYCGWAVPWQLPAYAITLAPDSRPMTNPPPETQRCARKEDMGHSQSSKKKKRK